MLSKKRLLIAVTLVMVIVLGSVSAVLAHGGDINLIHACVKNSSGEIRIITATGSCKTTEYPLDWGIIGPAGPQGIQGPVGDMGSNGNSVVTVSLPPGDPNCPNGGASFTADGATTYACNGSSAGALNLYNRYGQFTVPAYSLGSGAAYCDPGDMVISGGGAGGSHLIWLTATYVSFDNNTPQSQGWEVQYINNTGEDAVNMYVLAKCADTTP